MKHLPKHLRPRWRYLAIKLETWPDERIGRRSLQRELWYAGQNLLGDPGSADADLSVVRFEFGDGTGNAIVKVRRGETEPARAALACIDGIDGAPVGIRVCGISGTIRAAEENYLGRDGQESEEKTSCCSGTKSESPSCGTAVGTCDSMRRSWARQTSITI